MQSTSSRIATTALFSALAVACTAPLDPPSAVVVMQTVEAETDGVVVGLSASAPIRQLRFHDAAAFHREMHWRVLTPGYSIERDGGHQVLKATASAHVTDRVTVFIGAALLEHPRVYEPLVRFSDGGFALFTGYLGGTVATDDGFAGVGAEPATGRYEYIGERSVRVEHGVRFLFDPALPEWTRDTIRDRLPRLVGYFAERLAVRQDTQLSVLVAYVPDGGERRLNGGVANATMQIVIAGDGWEHDDPWSVSRLERFIAHEVAHFWNADLVRFHPGTPPALYEGSAEALGVRALLGIGALDAQRIAALVDSARAECGAGGARAPYACGLTRADMVERMLADAGAESDYFELWRLLMERAVAADGMYGAEDYEVVLAALIGAATVGLTTVR